MDVPPAGSSVIVLGIRGLDGCLGTVVDTVLECGWVSCKIRLAPRPGDAHLMEHVWLDPSSLTR